MGDAGFSIDAGADGVEVQVGDERPGIGTVVDDLGFEPTLKNMADALVAFVVADGESGEEPRHGPAEVALRGGEEQVIVVWHQHVGTELDMKCLTGLPQRVEELGVFVFRWEYYAPLIGSSHHVIMGSLVLDPRHPWHISILGSDPNFHTSKYIGV